MVVEIAAWPNVKPETMEHLLNASGVSWPVSGDKTALTQVHRSRRLTDRTLNREGYCWPDPVLVAGGWLQRKPVPAETVVTVRCEDCPWGLDVQGWDEQAAIAKKLAQRHADRRNHTVTATEAGQ